VFAAWFCIAVWRARKQTFVLRAAKPSRRDAALSLATLAGIAVLLGGVFTGALFAVEAAATGCCALIAATLASRALTKTDWQAALQSTLELSGALFAILLGATTFSLVLRAWGSDAWLAQALGGLGGAALVKAVLILLLIGACAWVLDAFEMIFVIVPIVAPLLIVQLGDAPQAAVLLLLVLQTSFLLPPLGYAVVMVKPAALSVRALLPALAQYAAVPLLAMVLILAWPQSLRLLAAPAAPVAAGLSEEDIAKAMNAVGENAAVEAEKAAAK
jgi:TRAP-type mannitol/chloroaromatic compound transport system permease large subunit